MVTPPKRSTHLPGSLRRASKSSMAPGRSPRWASKSSPRAPCFAAPAPEPSAPAFEPVASARTFSAVARKASAGALQLRADQPERSADPLERRAGARKYREHLHIAAAEASGPHYVAIAVKKPASRECGANLCSRFPRRPRPKFRQNPRDAGQRVVRVGGLE